MNDLYRELPAGAACLVSSETMSILAGYADDLADHNVDVTGHSQRVAAHSVDLARAIGYDEGALAAVWLYARFHDLGKLQVPAAILGQPGLLSPEQRKIVDMHGDYGAVIMDMIAGIPQEMKDVARYHHERYDGFGYNKLAGEQIPELARIVQVVDVYDAMVSKRTYKDGMAKGVALEAMTADNGVGNFGREMYDPKMLRAFVSIQLNQYADEMDVGTVSRLRSFAATHEEGVEAAPAPRLAI